MTLRVALFSNLVKEFPTEQTRHTLVAPGGMFERASRSSIPLSPASSALIRNFLVRAAAEASTTIIALSGSSHANNTFNACEIAHEFDDVSVRAETTIFCGGENGENDEDEKKKNEYYIALISIGFPKRTTTNGTENEDDEGKSVQKLTLLEAYGSIASVRAVRVVGRKEEEEEEEEAPEFGYDATIEIDLNALNEEENKEEIIDLISRVRLYAGYGTLRACLRRLATNEKEEDANRSFALRRQFAAPSVSMYCKVEEDVAMSESAEEKRSCTVVFPMHVSSSLSNNEDEVVIARAFLAHFAEASRNNAKLSAAPFVSYHKPGQKLPLELTTNVDATRDGGGDEVDEMDLNANGGYISFVIFPRHVKTKESMERAVWMLASFPNFIKSHLKCSKGYWHGKMRKKAEELLETLKRAKKEPKVSAKKKLMSGRTYVPR